MIQGSRRGELEPIEDSSRFGAVASSSSSCTAGKRRRQDGETSTTRSFRVGATGRTCQQLRRFWLHKHGPKQTSVDSISLRTVAERARAFSGTSLVRSGAVWWSVCVRFTAGCALGSMLAGARAISVPVPVPANPGFSLT